MLSDSRSLTLQPLRATDASGEAARVLGKLESQDADLLVFRVLANSEAMLRPFVKFAAALVGSAALDARERELVVLHLAAKFGSVYEWREHAPMARAAGVSEAEIEVIAAGDTSSLPLTDRERAAIRFCEDVANGGADVDEARRIWGEAELIDLTLIAAWWGCLLPPVLSTLGLERLVARDDPDLPAR